MNRKVSCSCGRIKDSRAKHCVECRKNEWLTSKAITKAKRYNKCGCGKNKDKRAPRCQECRLKADGVKRSRTLTCPKCGKPKSEKSATCLNCFKQSLSNILPNGNIICTVCNNELPTTAFHIIKRSRSGRMSCCKSCYRKSRRRYAIIKRCLKHGLKPKLAAAIADLTEINCWICGEPTTTKRFHVDHCHTSNRFRGLLCANCNHGLGCFKDNQTSLAKAISYLTLTPAQRLAKLNP